MNSEKLPWEDVSDQLDHFSLPPHRVPAEKSDAKRGRRSAVTYDNETKIEVAMEALKEKITQRELSIKLGVPQPLIRSWKDLATQSIRECFEKESNRGPGKRTKSARLDSQSTGTDLIALQQLAGTLRETADLIERSHMKMSASSDKVTGD
jgi:transposase-like protein